jgi:hypothetical protein
VTNVDMIAFNSVAEHVTFRVVGGSRRFRGETGKHCDALHSQLVARERWAVTPTASKQALP